MDKLTTTTHDYKINFWTDRIKECRTSGMTVADWCEQNNIGVKNYYYWMRKIKREAFESLPSNCIEKVPVVTNSNMPVFSKINLPVRINPESHTAVSIRMNGIVIDIQDGASEMTIQNTLRAIRSLC